MNAQRALIVSITMPLVTILKAPITVPANQDFTETAKIAAKVSQQYVTFEIIPLFLLKENIELCEYLL